MAKCQVCGRGPQFGHNVSHSNRKTNRRWNVNVQRATVVNNGKKQRLRLCTRCLRTTSKTRS
ncbi:MAG: 50S ribosomal protein L28 [SAR202 cluster bacterium]|nr:50S ribosomal protein L28 [SAR202 cluster bacterium]